MKTTKKPKTTNATSATSSKPDTFKPTVLKSEAPETPKTTAMKASEPKAPMKAAPVSAPAAGPKPEAHEPNGPKVNHVLLELVKPGAKSVCVAGSFNQWKPEKTPLSPKGNDRWVGDLTIKPGRHEYLFVVDGQWVPDPNAQESVANPFGGRNSVLIVSE